MFINKPSKVVFIVAGGVAFPFEFKWYNESDINVYYVPPGVEANDEDSRVSPVDYTITSNASKVGGSVSIGITMLDGGRVTIQRELPITRTIDYTRRGAFRAATVNDDNDYQTYLALDAYANSNSYISVPTSGEEGFKFPSPGANEEYLRWDAEGNLINDVEPPLWRDETEIFAYGNPVGSGTIQKGALQYAQDSSNSAAESGASASSSEDSNLDAESWANEDEGVPVKVHNNGVPSDRVPLAYSAKNYAVAAEGVTPLAIGNINAPLLDLPLKSSLAMNKGVGSVTTTRATTATILDRYGSVKDLAIDEIGFNKDGILIEGESTNLALYSNDFSNVVWNDGGGSKTLSAEVAPDGVSPAWDLVSNVSGIVQTVNITGLTSEVYSMSFYAKKLTSTTIRLQMDSGGVVPVFNFDTETFTSGGQNGKAVKLANGWWFLQAFGLSRTSDGVINMRIFPEDGLGTTVAFAQMEKQEYATSYIPTTAAAVTRTASLTTATAYDNIPNLNEDWSVCVDITTNVLVTDARQYLIAMNQAQTNSIVRFQSSGTTGIAFVTRDIDDSVKSLIVKSGVVADETYRIAVTYDKGNRTFTAYADGILGLTLIATADFESLASLLKFNGPSYDPTVVDPSPFISLKNIKYYDRTLTAEEVRIG